MTAQPDYSILDIPEILQFAFYPRREWTPLPPGAKDYSIPVEPDVSISCRLYPAGENSPCILFFHGNGEIVCDYDCIAPAYNRLGISLFVADYRGYGQSNGQPAFSTLLSDAHSIFNFFLDIFRSGNRDIPLFIMGRSLGSHSAVELASRYQEHLKGLIIESGSGNIIRLFSHMGFPVDRGRLKELEDVAAARVRSLTLPLLIIHGEHDDLVPPGEATRLFDTTGSSDKRLVTIPYATHNDIIVAGMEQYFTAIKDFVFPQGH